MERATSWKRGKKSITEHVLTSGTRECCTGEMKKRDGEANQNQMVSADFLHYLEHVPVFLVQRGTSVGEEEVSCCTDIHAKELARVSLK